LAPAIWAGAVPLTLVPNGSNPPTAADFHTIQDGPQSTHKRPSQTSSPPGGYAH
jgi:hypothetical protein